MPFFVVTLTANMNKQMEQWHNVPLRPMGGARYFQLHPSSLPSPTFQFPFWPIFMRLILTIIWTNNMISTQMSLILRTDLQSTASSYWVHTQWLQTWVRTLSLTPHLKINLIKYRCKIYLGFACVQKSLRFWRVKWKGSKFNWERLFIRLPPSPQSLIFLFTH